MIVARFIYIDLEPNQLPTHWTYPDAGLFEGAQVLDVEEALAMAASGEHVGDDFFKPSLYGHLALIRVESTTGERGPLGYDAITADDIQEMRVIEYNDAALGWELMEIAMQLEEEGADIDLDAVYGGDTDWMSCRGDEIAALLWRDARPVTPEFVDTLTRM